MKQAIIFDMDGVICDTNPWHSKAFRAFFQDRGVRPSDAEFERHMYGKSNSYIMSHFLGRKISGDELAELENEKEARFRDIYQPHVEPIKGFLPFLQLLSDQGLKLGVATSAPKANMLMILTELGIIQHFDSLMASEDVLHHKPNPEVYLTSATRLDVNPHHCIVFEDSFSGTRAGIRAGMTVIAVMSSHGKDQLPGCDHYIDEYDQKLVHYLQQQYSIL